ncbi:MAG: 4Fe-4S dicluster domain-containing protein, partial [Bacilli bacterium]
IQTLGDPCWHCGECCSQCPMDLQPVQIQMALVSNDLERMIALDADKCVGCGLCSYVCPSRIDVTQNVLKAKALVIKAKKERK